MSTPPNLPTTWADASTRPTNLAAAINDLATAVNTMLPLGTGFVSYTPALTATTTDPTLGTGSVATGRYFQFGKFVIANFAIKFGTSGTNAGSGAYRVSLPVPCTTLANTNSFVVGYGHIRNPNEGFLGLGPSAYRGVTFHTAPSVSTSVVGIVLNTNQPDPTAGHLSDGYTITNATGTDRTMNVTAPTGTYAEAIAEETRDVLASLLTDLDETFKYSISDNCANAVPWAWAASYEIQGTYFYEAA